MESRFKAGDTVKIIKPGLLSEGKELTVSYGSEMTEHFYIRGEDLGNRAGEVRFMDNSAILVRGKGMSISDKGKYYVYNANGSKPTKLHETKSDAIEEASRLAANSSAEYLVLKVENIVRRAKPPIEVI